MEFDSSKPQSEALWRGGRLETNMKRRERRNVLSRTYKLRFEAHYSESESTSSTRKPRLPKTILNFCSLLCVECLCANLCGQTCQASDNMKIPSHYCRQLLEV